MAEAVFVTHENPLGREAPYYMARVDLAYAGLAGQVEQLWLNEVGDGTLQIACIPFCAYGLAYRDIVRLDSVGVNVRELVRPSGHRALRSLLSIDMDADTLRQTRAALIQVADKLAIAAEWHGDRYVAFDVPPTADPTQLVLTLDLLAGEGRAHHEWSDRHRFSP